MKCFFVLERICFVGAAPLFSAFAKYQDNETSCADVRLTSLVHLQTGSSPGLLSNIPFSHPTVSNIFKAEHPFSNYWTHQGGLAEVLRVLPSKDQSDM